MLSLLLAIATAAAAAPNADFAAAIHRTRAAYCRHDLKAAAESLPALRSASAALPERDGRKAMALMYEADVLRATDDAAGANNALDGAERVLRGQGQKGLVALADLLFSRVGQRRAAGDYAGALRYGKETRALFRRLGRSEEEAATLVELGEAEGGLGVHAAAAAYHRRATALFKRLKKPDSMATAEANEAVEEAALGRPEKAEALFLDAITILKQRHGTRDAVLSTVAGLYSDFLRSLGPARAADAARWDDLSASAVPVGVDVGQAGTYACSDK